MRTQTHTLSSFNTLNIFRRSGSESTLNIEASCDTSLLKILLSFSSVSAGISYDGGISDGIFHSLCKETFNFRGEVEKKQHNRHLKQRCDSSGQDSERSMECGDCNADGNCVVPPLPLPSSLLHAFAPHFWAFSCSTALSLRSYRQFYSETCLNHFPAHVEHHYNEHIPELLCWQFMCSFGAYLSH